MCGRETGNEKKREKKEVSGCRGGEGGKKLPLASLANRTVGLLFRARVAGSAKHEYKWV